MIPIRDNLRENGIPVITWTLIALNCILFLWDRQGKIFAGNIVFSDLAMRPSEVVNALSGNGNRLDIVTVFTSIFLHANLVHLFGNMVFGLPAVMSKYLSLGMTLPDVVAACTQAPADLIGMQGRVGSLAPGAFADVAIFELTDKEFPFQNLLGETFCGNQLLLPKLTILNGRVVFRQIDFPF